jgi:primary-amine oxidase
MIATIALLLLTAQAPASAHPLDPLTAAEIATAAQVIRAHAGIPKEVFFVTVALQELAKADVREFKPGAAFRREAFVVLFDRAANRTIETVVDLRKKSVTSTNEVPGAQPAILTDEFDRVPPLVRADPSFRQAMAKRGITGRPR